MYLYYHYSNITVDKVPTETKQQVEEVRCDMVVYDSEILKIELAEDEAPLHLRSRLWMQPVY